MKRFVGKPGCPTCNGVGLFYCDDGNGYKVCACMPEAVALGIIGNSGLPKRHAEFKVRDYQAQNATQKAMMETVVEWIKGFHPCGKGLMLVGSPGTGKTALLCAAARALATTKQVSVRYYSAFDWILRYKAVNTEHEGTRDLLESVGEFDLLILDDLGSEHATDYTRSAIHALVDYCYNQEIAVACSTNIALDKLNTHLDERTVDRLQEMCIVAETTGQSYRKKGK